LNRVNLIK
jgi:hypothetical protein